MLARPLLRLIVLHVEFYYGLVEEGVTAGSVKVIGGLLLWYDIDDLQGFKFLWGLETLNP